MAITTRFETAHQVRDFLADKGFSRGAFRVRKTHSPFTGALFFRVSLKNCDECIASLDGEFYGQEGSKAVPVMNAMQNALRGTNALVG